jgi:nucleotide-binding universal stress UspA family protein
MFNHLLVPLDGSPLAEATLPFACEIARNCNSTITLLHIIETDAPAEIHGHIHLQQPLEAEKYLEQIKARMLEKHPTLLAKKILTHVHTEKQENLARSIVNHSEELTPDLILLTHHGSTGLRDRTVGSIAQQVIGMGQKPTLLIHTNRSNEKYKQFNNILVALDTDPEHAASVDFANQLAISFSSRVILFSVVPTFGTMSLEQAAAGRLLPGSVTALLDLEEDRCFDYLEKIKKDQFHGIKSVLIDVQRGDPVKMILRGSRRHSSDLIVLSSHGKAGWSAFWEGSVASKVITGSERPMLIIPV